MYKRQALYPHILGLEIMNGAYVTEPEKAMESSFEWLKDKINGLQ